MAPSPDSPLDCPPPRCLLYTSTYKDTYLNEDLLIDILHKTGADAVHPGYGFLSEVPSFAQKVEAVSYTHLDVYKRQVDGKPATASAQDMVQLVQTAGREVSRGLGYSGDYLGLSS